MAAESPPGTSHIPGRTDTESVRCRACGNQETRFALEAESPASGSELRRFFLCPECGSLLDADVRRPAYGGDADAAGLSDETPSIKFCVEFGVGIEGFVAWIGLVRDALGKTPWTPRLLEVGAGFGFLAAVAE
jgi:hypothetical protein